MSHRRSSLAQLLGNVGIKVRQAPARGRRQPAAAVVRATADPTTCHHMFNHGRCMYCLQASPYAHAPRRGAGKPVQHEKHEQSKIAILFRSIGSQVYVLGTRRARGDQQGTRQTPGIPDLYIWLPLERRYTRPGLLLAPKFLWFEVKAEGGRTSSAQQEFELLCTTHGHPYLRGGFDRAHAFLVQHGFITG